MQKLFWTNVSQLDKIGNESVCIKYIFYIKLWWYTRLWVEVTYLICFRNHLTIYKMMKSPIKLILQFLCLVSILYKNIPNLRPMLRKKNEQLNWQMTPWATVSLFCAYNLREFLIKSYNPRLKPQIYSHLLNKE